MNSWPTSAAEARREFELEEAAGRPHGILEFSIDGGRLYGRTDQGWICLWEPAEGYA